MSSQPNPAAAQPPARGTGQHISITSGDSSPVNVTAPYTVAEAGGTAHAGAGPLAGPGHAAPLWSRTSVLWTAVGSLGAVAAAVIAFFALIK